MSYHKQFLYIRYACVEILYGSVDPQDHRSGLTPPWQRSVPLGPARRAPGGHGRWHPLRCRDLRHGR